MRREPLLTAVPESPVQNLAELYAIAAHVSQQAVMRYGALAERRDSVFSPIRGVFEVLVTRERECAEGVSAACLLACGKRPDRINLRWTPTDLVPAAELADLSDSGLSTPYLAWALAVRHRQRAFVFWTYVVALAENPEVRRAAQDLARQALSDSDQLRRDRRTAWRAERQAAADDAAAAHTGSDQPVSAALLESLLHKDLIAWSQGLAPAERERLQALDPARLPTQFLMPLEASGSDPVSEDPAQITRRALRRAEQLSNIYLDEADRATDQSSMELAQKLAAQSITRLAGLRRLASIATDRP
jgi:hypothetical protein